MPTIALCLDSFSPCPTMCCALPLPRRRLCGTPMSFRDQAKEGAGVEPVAGRRLLSVGDDRGMLGVAPVAPRAVSYGTPPCMGVIDSTSNNKCTISARVLSESTTVT